MLYAILLISAIGFMANIYVIWKLMPHTTKSATTVLVDTSVLMDGRILDIVRSGFMPVEILVPRFVIAELQLLADKSDHMKRERARFGLQVVKELQDSRFANLTLIKNDVSAVQEVDGKLVLLAKKLNTQLFTTDYNLLKVAEIEGIKVLNINELAQNIRTTHIPGEQMQLKIVAKGQEKTQGVGYLEDGTMVVVEKAGSEQGRTITVEITRNLQTAAGRMMFAKKFNAKGVNKRSSTPSIHKRKQPETLEDRLISAINAK